MGSFLGDIWNRSSYEREEPYLRFDLTAPDEDSMGRWMFRFGQVYKGSLKRWIPRDTHRKLVVADDEPKLMHKAINCSLYIPLKRNQDEVVQKGQQFDLRSTLDEFMRKVYEWKDWEPGMEIKVSLVRRDQIPSDLFKKANHNELQQAPNHCAVEKKVGQELDIERMII